MDHLSPLTHSKACDVLSFLGKGGNIALVPALLQSLGWAPLVESLYVMPRTGSGPASVIFSDGERWWMFIDGIRTIAEANAIKSGWSDNGVALFGLRAHTQAANVAGNLGPPLTDRLFANLLDVTIMGYSFGAMIGEIIGFLILKRTSAINVNLVTFGAPRSQWAGDQTAWSLLPAIRYANINDVTVNLPPHADELPLLQALIVAPALVSWDLWLHGRGGLLLYPGGSVQFGTETVQFSDDPLANFGATLLGQGTGHAEHDLETYSLRLRQYDTQRRQIDDQEIVQGAGAEQLPPSLGHLEETPGSVHLDTPKSKIIADMIQKSLADFRAAQLQFQHGSRGMSSHLPDALKMLAIKKTPQTPARVMWMGRIVAEGSNARMRGIARVGNKFLREMLAETAAAAVMNLGASMVDWGAMASIALNGAVPPLTTINP